MKKLLTMTAFAMMAVGAQAQLRSGIDLSDMNPGVAAGNDFYEYACGGWMTKNPLPAAYSRFGSFDRLGQDNDKRINGILQAGDGFRPPRPRGCTAPDAPAETYGRGQDRAAVVRHSVGAGSVWRNGFLQCRIGCR